VRLSEVSIGSTADVIAVHGEGSVPQRLMEVGIVPGLKVRIIMAAPFGSPIEIRVRGYSLALRTSEAEAIEVAV